MQQKQKVETVFSQFNANKSSWNQPFNQCLFLNYDTTAPVKISANQSIPPATTTFGNIYPSQLCIGLNVGEVNATDFTFDFGGSTGANLHIIFTKYL